MQITVRMYTINGTIVATRTCSLQQGHQLNRQLTICRHVATAPCPNYWHMSSDHHVARIARIIATFRWSIVWNSAATTRSFVIQDCQLYNATLAFYFFTPSIATSSCTTASPLVSFSFLRNMKFSCRRKPRPCSLSKWIFVVDVVLKRGLVTRVHLYKERACSLGMVLFSKAVFIAQVFYMVLICVLSTCSLLMLFIYNSNGHLQLHVQNIARS